MSDKNICKFNPTRSSDLTCHNFIYESTDCKSACSEAEHHVLHLTVIGGGSFNCGEKSYPIKAGTLFFVRRGERFSIVGNGDLEYSYISFDGRRADELIDRVGINGNHRVFEGHEDLIPFWRECLESADARNLDLLAESVLLYSLARLEPERAERNDLISRVLAITAENFTDHKLTLASVAQSLGYHEKYVSTMFRKNMGITYTAYIRDMRLSHAVFLMEQGVVSVKNVALLSGFFDALYFSKVFKEAKGVSPKEYIADLESFSGSIDKEKI